MKMSSQQVYAVFIGMAGTAIVAWAFLTPIGDGLPLILFCALVAAAEWTTSTLLEGHSSISIASAVSFAAAVIFAPSHAGLAGAVGGAASAVSHIVRQRHSRRRAVEVLLFNTGMYALATIGAALAFQWLHNGMLTGVIGLADAPALIVSAAVSDQVNAAVLVVMIALQSGQRPLAIWRENFAWAAPMNVATMAFGGGALATGFEALGLTGLLVFFLPVFLSAYAFRAYVTRTRAVMARLEETVQVRTADLARANERLLEMHQQKDAFFAVITHDMRSPLTSMLGFGELLGQYGQLSPEVQPFVGAIRRNTETLISMVNDILDLAKLDSGKMEYKWEAVNLTTIVGDVVNDSAGHALSRQIQLESRLDEMPPIAGDDEKLRRMVTNLVSNAIKYTREGGRVDVELHRRDSEIALSVRDTGIGIPAEQLPHIFERFRRVRRKSGSDAVGTGLGLSIVQEFAQAHGGRVEVQSVENVGSTFTVTLPVRYEPPPPA